MNRALILDFGGVITRTLFETHALTETALGLAPGTLDWQGPFAPETDALWRDMQAGTITERDYWRRRTAEVGGLLGENWTEMSQFVRAARGAEPEAVIRPEFRAAIAQVKAAGLKLAILSNELDLFYGADFRDRLPFLADFDVIVDATYSGILKPDPRAYAACLDQLGLPAGACVFVDDQRRNIAGAEAVGLPHVHFDVANPAASYSKALQMLGLSKELSA
ncbi:HAD family hydrolase [Pseudodonghicola flavimaris]|uniref:HAD-IA family hydrolase n=1 Tax=Pseudodonghicola flavimaris TaxID=3050036 RepID=A0ABT7F3H5_9RHOB|nr:HAD-IA family hydrolase [Pseudodonghicola flavimaris]MDK3018974.1 HAD-IA family hydrolase [Pseudodonghicola flavimaris]